MRTVILTAGIGLLLVLLLAVVSHGGETARGGGYVEASAEEVRDLLGDWEAAVHTPGGWHGTLRAKVSMERNHPEGSEFHGLLTLTYALEYGEPRPKATAGGTARVAVIPVHHNKHRYFQCLAQSDVLMREFYEEVLDRRPNDKKAKKGLADLQPSSANTAAVGIHANSWSLELAPALTRFLPSQVAKAPPIDWSGTLQWRRVKAR